MKASEIWIVHDDPERLNQIAASFSKSGYNNIRPFSCSVVAITEVENGYLPSAVIIYDDMPIISGVQFAGFLKDLAPDTSVVVLTEEVLVRSVSSDNYLVIPEKNLGTFITEGELLKIHAGKNMGTVKA